MTENSSRLQNKLKIAAALLMLGLLTEIVTLQWAHPTSFLLFIIVGGTLIVLGVAMYLLALITT